MSAVTPPADLVAVLARHEPWKIVPDPGVGGGRWWDAIKAANENNMRAYAAMCQIVGRCQAQEAGFCEPLVTVLAHEHAFVRYAAAEALGWLGDRAAVGPLLATLADEDDVVRRRVVGALGLLGDPGTIGPIATVLREDADPRVRRRAAISLGKIGDRDVIGPLIGALRDEDRVVRLRATEVLALPLLADDRVVEPLVQLLTQRREHWRARRAAARALARISPGSRALLMALAQDDASVMGWVPKTLKRGNGLS